MEIRRITVRGQSVQKVSEAPSQPIKLDVVVCACHSYSSGGLNSKIKAKI
jgi:hypothetical protein